MRGLGWVVLGLQFCELSIRDDGMIPRERGRGSRFGLIVKTHHGYRHAKKWKVSTGVGVGYLSGKRSYVCVHGRAVFKKKLWQP